MTYQPRPELAETSARIADAMTRRALSPRQVTEALGLAERDPGNVNVSNWTRGKHAPRFVHREKLAELLGLKAEDLVPEGWDNPRGRPTSLSPTERLARKRETDRKYRQSLREQKHKPGPAEQAVMLYSDNRPEPVPVSRVPAPPRPEDVFTTAIRADGTMQVRLNLTLPIAEGIALVQMLYAADALKAVV